MNSSMGASCRPLVLEVYKHLVIIASCVPTSSRKSSVLMKTFTRIYKNRCWSNVPHRSSFVRALEAGPCPVQDGLVLSLVLLASWGQWAAASKLDGAVLWVGERKLGWGEQQRGRPQRPITIRRTTSKALLSSSKPDAVYCFFSTT